MKIYYDNEVDAVYIKLGDASPEGVTEISAGINLDITTDGKLVGIEILNASLKIDIQTILSYSLELKEDFICTKECFSNRCFHTQFLIT